MERNKTYVPVNYRDFVHQLEQIIEPTKKKYTATECEFKKDKNRFDQYKDDMASKADQYIVQKRNEDIIDEMKEETTADADEKKPYRLNTENFF